LWGLNEEEKKTADEILKRYFDHEIDFDESLGEAIKKDLDTWYFERYLTEEENKRWSEDLRKYTGKVKKEAFKEHKIKATEEELELLKKYPKDLSLDKAVRDRVTRMNAAFEIGFAKGLYEVAIKFIEEGHADWVKHLPFTDEALKEILEEYQKSKLNKEQE
jgi:hypothetical protein